MFPFDCKALVQFSAASVIILGAIVLLVFWHGPEQDTENCPKAFVAIDRVDLGVVRPSERQEVAFLVENNGRIRLILNELGCGCGSPARPTIVVQPGKTESVAVLLESGSELEKIERKVSFATNDQLRPRIDLTVVAQVNDL
jgi:hypothetical protein